MAYLAAKAVHTVDSKHVVSATEAPSLIFTGLFETLSPLRTEVGSDIYNALPMNHRSQMRH